MISLIALFVVLAVLLTLAFIVIVFFKTEIKNILAARKLKKQEFNCSQCGKCCSFTVVVGDFDVHQLKEAGFDTDSCVSTKFGVRHLTKTDGYCSFLENGACLGKKSCGIYNDRLYICRRFPYISYSGFNAIDTRCTEVQNMLNSLTNDK